MPRPASTRNTIPTFPARLAELRLRANLTRRQLAEAAGTSEGAICHLELAARSPSLELAGRIALALGVSVDALFYAPGCTVYSARKDFPK